MKTFRHFCRVLAGLDQPQTQVTQGELSAMLNHAHSARNIVEIGCFEGATAMALATSTQGQVYSIDLFTRGRAGICFGYWIVRTQLVKMRIDNVHLIAASSQEAARKIHIEIDFLFIDGDHSRKGVERDWSDWYPKVKVGGVIAMHDCKASHNSPVELGTMEFYRERLAAMHELAEIESVDSLVVFKKLR